MERLFPVLVPDCPVHRSRIKNTELGGADLGWREDWAAEFQHLGFHSPFLAGEPVACSIRCRSRTHWVRLPPSYRRASDVIDVVNPIVQLVRRQRRQKLPPTVDIVDQQIPVFRDDLVWTLANVVGSTYVVHPCLFNR